MTGAGPGVEFLAHYTESEGGLVELGPDGALLVMPGHLRQQLSAPEDLRVTEDPEVAREDGLVLVTVGHPLLTAASRAVLDRGDIGSARLARAVELPPTPDAIETKARQHVYADHGRLDAAGAPEMTILVVLRAAALVTYAISIDERVQEVEEIWLDSSSGQEVPSALRAVLCSAALEPATTPDLAMPSEQSLGAADSIMAARAAIRASALARESSPRLAQQLKVVDDYYEGVLASLDERRARATEHRAGLLEAQAEATKTEWSRRRAEATEELTPVVEVHPFRLHVLAVPVYRVPFVVRRGAREYPLDLRYVPATATFLVPPCPGCGASATLVAAKDRLGCRSCLAASPQPGLPAPKDRPPAVGEPPVTRERAVPKGSPAPKVPTGAPGLPTSQSRLEAPKAPMAVPKVPKRSGVSSGRVTPKGGATGSPLEKSGLRVAVSFWTSAWSGELKRTAKVVPGSPLAALLRLYGSRGPALVVGASDRGSPEGIGTSTVDAYEDALEVTAGDLRFREGSDVPFALFWRRSSGALVEVEAFPLERLGYALTSRGAAGSQLRDRLEAFLRAPPAPLSPLAHTPALLLDRAARFLGLAYATRCLAVWWYLTEEVVAFPEQGSGDPTLAAAVELVVSRRAGLPVTAPTLAERYNCPVEPVRRLARRAQTAIDGVTGLRW